MIPGVILDAVVEMQTSILIFEPVGRQRAIECRQFLQMLRAL